MISAHDAQEIANLKMFQWLLELKQQYSTELKYVEKTILDRSNRGLYCVNFSHEKCPVEIHPVLRYMGYKIKIRNFRHNSNTAVVVSWN